MKVLSVVITKDVVEPACLASIIQQGYPWVVRGEQPTPLPVGANPHIHYNQNLAANREAARIITLASDADYFMFVDSDVVLPPHAITEFMKQVGKRAPQIPGLINLPNEKHIQCGWLLLKDQQRWVGGCWVGDHVFQFYYCPEPSLVRTDLVATGCMFISRAALAKLRFSCPGDKVHLDTKGNEYFIDEAMQFSVDAGDAGYLMYLNGSVVCQHLDRSK